MPRTLSPAEIEAFRERLCDVAERLFAQHGPDAVTVRQLAGELGVSSMTPYRYFKDKDAMLAAVRTRAFDRFAEAMETARRTATTPGLPYVDFALAHPEAYRLMFDVNQPSFANYPDLVAAMERARLTMSGAVPGDCDGPLDAETELMAHVLWSAMHGAIMLELAGLLSAPIDARAILRPTIEALLARFGMPPWRAS